MTEADIPLPPADIALLTRAVSLIEQRSFATLLTEYSGLSVAGVFRLLPSSLSKSLDRAAAIAIRRCLDIALGSLATASGSHARTRTSTLLIGISGGISGFVGAAALPFELPVTTTLLLHSIAEIAREEGEDLSTIEARLACLEVFALGGGGKRIDIGYYASRALLGRLASEATAVFVERGATRAVSPLMGGFVSEIAARFGVVASERAMVAAVPVIGALGGATLNTIFANHFHNVARGHFIVRRLERKHGRECITALYKTFVEVHASERQKAKI